MIMYIVGDATKPVCDTPGNIRIIPHICNSIGVWGAGFVKAISKKWPEAEREYRQLDEYKLGSVQFVKVDNNTIIANMIAQEGVGLANGPPIRYESLAKTLAKVDRLAHLLSDKYYVSIHMPKIGTGLAGGKWELIEPLLQSHLHFDTYVYILESEINA